MTDDDYIPAADNAGRTGEKLLHALFVAGRKLKNAEKKRQDELVQGIISRPSGTGEITTTAVLPAEDPITEEMRSRKISLLDEKIQQRVLLLRLKKLIEIRKTIRIFLERLKPLLRKEKRRAKKKQLSQVEKHLQKLDAISKAAINRTAKKLGYQVMVNLTTQQKKTKGKKRKSRLKRLEKKIDSLHKKIDRVDRNVKKAKSQKGAKKKTRARKLSAAPTKRKQFREGVQG